VSAAQSIRKLSEEIMNAFAFLTRIPLPSTRFEADSLSNAVKFFPLVGLIVGIGAAVLHKLALPHLGRPIAGLIVLVYLVLITGCFHEDGLADTVDAFGGGWNRDQILVILKDSRIGSYGATALTLSILARYLLLVSLPLEHFDAYVISSQVLCRWSSLPLGYLLPSAPDQKGLGTQVARLSSFSSLAIGSLFSVAVVIFLLRWSSLGPVLLAMLTVAVSGWFYFKKIGGVTGDCFGATNQFTEVMVYLCGAWII
jgi:adenosylcobinamide-GDP ribazoletransferase